MSDMYDNITVGVMTKVNELAARFGIQPYQFSAILSESTHNDITPWELGISYNDRDMAALRPLVQAITGDPNIHVLREVSPGAILRKLCNSLQVAPQQRGAGVA